MIVTTTPEIAGKTIVEYKGIVFGEVMGGKALMGGWTRDSVIKEFESTMMQVKNEALNRLISHASQVGANAVVGIEFNFNYIGTSMTASATGTAVIIA